RRHTRFSRDWSSDVCSSDLDKSLALVRWVLANTGFARVLKVDDDCHLQADAWFGDLTHLRHDYLGRPLTRVPGQMDRTWHMAKRSEERRVGEEWRDRASQSD